MGIQDGEFKNIFRMKDVSPFISNPPHLFTFFLPRKNHYFPTLNRQINNFLGLIFQLEKRIQLSYTLPRFASVTMYKPFLFSEECLHTY